jgi:hypothetical protein
MVSDRIYKDYRIEYGKDGHKIIKQDSHKNKDALGFIRQLSTCGVDVLPPRSAYGYNNTILLQYGYVHFDSGIARLPKFPVIYWIVFYKIDLGWSKFTEIH